MKIETNRLILRELLLTDDVGLFELDTNPQVHQYLGNNPIKTMHEARTIIAMVMQQYATNGIGRWAVIEKTSGDFIGWCGLKFIQEHENNHINFYDIGYRLIPKYWGMGYATEAAQAVINYGFHQLQLKEIFASAHVENKSSQKVLQKCGLSFIESYQWQQIPCNWYRITKAEWQLKRNTLV